MILLRCAQHAVDPAGGRRGGPPIDRRMPGSALVAVAVVAVVAVASVAQPAHAVPTFAQVRAAHAPSDLTLLARDAATPVQTVRLDRTVRRLPWLALDDVSPALRTALVLSEDRRFHEHAGIDWRAVAAGAWASAWNTRTRGASTLTMQLAGLLDDDLARPAGGRGAAAKVAQALAATRLEAAWKKTEILEAYLNLVAWRGEVVGVNALAQTLFGKHASGLDAEEAAIAAALVRGPNATAATVARRACGVLALQGLPCAGVAGRTEAALARPGTMPLGEQMAPHFARQVVAARLPSGAGNAAHDDLAGPDREPPGVPARGRPSPASSSASTAASASASAAAGRPDVLRLGVARTATSQSARSPSSPASRSPATIVTTLDAGLQRVAVEALRRHVGELASRRVEDGAVLVLDNATGDVLAWVGSTGTALSGAAQVDGVTARRQPGSTLKPFVYELAFEKRYLTPASLLDDAPAQLATSSGLYAPQNYDRAYKGWVSARTALAASLNVPAVRVGALLGPDALVERLNAWGLALPQTGGYYGPALALGGADVTLLHLTNAYRALANGGVVAPPRLRLADPVGARKRVADAAAVHLVGDILADNAARAATFGFDSALAARGWAAVKTGTSKDMRDNWCVGYTRRHTVGVWVGNAGGAPMHGVSGTSGAAPVWRAVVAYLGQRQVGALHPGDGVQGAGPGATAGSGFGVTAVGEAGGRLGNGGSRGDAGAAGSGGGAAAGRRLQALEGSAQPAADASRAAGAVAGETAAATATANAPVARAGRPAGRPPLPPGVVALPIVFEDGAEPPRTELFLAGTEQAVQRRPGGAAGRVSAGIDSPRDGSLFALDPDIPPAAQRIVFEGRPGTWVLDGRTLGRGPRWSWPPWPGRHALELRDDAGRTVGRVAFEVRGAGVKAAPPPSPPTPGNPVRRSRVGPPSL